MCVWRESKFVCGERKCVCLERERLCVVNKCVCVVVLVQNVCVCACSSTCGGVLQGYTVNNRAAGSISNKHSNYLR